MANIVGYPSAVIQGPPGKSGRIQGLGAVVPPPAFDPLDISNIIAWWDAGQNVSTITGDVDQWDDQSVNANNLVQSIVTDRPFYDTGSDTTPFIQFDGLNDYLRILAYAGGQKTQPMTFAFVARDNTPSGVGWLFDAAVTTDNLGWLTIGGTTWQMFAGGGGTLNTGSDMNKNIFMGVYNTGASNLYINGGAAKASGVVGVDPQDGIILGARTTTGNHSEVDYYDFTVYDKVVPTSELNDLGNYFATKHGLTWTTIP